MIDHHSELRSAATGEPQALKPTKPRREAALDRRENVGHLLGRGLTLRQIAREIGASLRSVERDVRGIRVARREALSQVSVEDVGGNVIAAAASRRSRLETLYLAAADPFLQLKLLRAMLENDVAEIDALQTLGVIFKATPKVTAFMSHVAAFSALPVDVLDRIASGTAEEGIEIARQQLGQEAVTALLAAPSAIAAIAGVQCEGTREQ